MGEPNNALKVYMKRPERVRSVLEYFLGRKLPGDWKVEAEEGFYTLKNSKGKLTFRERAPGICGGYGNGGGNGGYVQGIGGN